MDGFAVIAEPTRRAIVDRLRLGESDVGGLVDELRVSQSLVSKHLRVLREVGLVQVHDRGRQRVYRLDGEPLRPIYEWVRRYEQTWNARYDLLDTVLDELQHPDRASGQHEGETP